MLVHSDLCGSKKEFSWGGACYLLSFTDYFSRKSFGYLLKKNNQTLKVFLKFKMFAENQTGLSIKTLDDAGEYCNRLFDF